MGTLNLYSKKRSAFDDEALAVGSVFATHAAVALAGAQQDEQMYKALQSRDVIGQAKGILMAQQNVNADEAFDILRRASQRMNIKLREVAERVASRTRRTRKLLRPPKRSSPTARLVRGRRPTAVSMPDDLLSDLRSAGTACTVLPWPRPQTSRGCRGGHITTSPGGAGNLEVESLLIEGEAVLRLSGGLDMDSASLFAEAARLVLTHEIPILVLDLSGLNFIDSSGLREFVVAFKRQREIGGDLVLRAPTEQVRRVLDIVGLSEMLTMAPVAAGVPRPPGRQPRP